MKNRHWHRIASALIPAALLAVTLAQYFHTADRESRRINVFQVDCYYYQSLAENVQRGRGPCVSWPQGPQNKYFPGFAYWWSLFLKDGQPAEASVRDYVLAQGVLLALFMVALGMLGWGLWRDWTLALAFAVLAAANPLVLKWACVPLSELLAAVCVTALATAALRLERRRRFGPRIAGARPAKSIQDWVALAALAGFGAVGLLTRMEGAYVLGLLVAALVVRRRLGWLTGAGVLLAAAVPFSIWQLWAYSAFHETSSYFQYLGSERGVADWFDRAFFQYAYFVRAPNVLGPIVAANALVLVFALLYTAALIAALRGYLGRFSLFSAWLVAGYWLLHGAWFFETERYNVVIVAFGYVFIVDGFGRLYNLRRGWRARGGRWALALLCLLCAPAFWVHGQDNVRAMSSQLNRQGRPLPGARAIRRALESDPQSGPGGWIFLTNAAEPEGRLLPGEVWFEKMAFAPPLYAPGHAVEVIRRTGVTHLALKPPIDDWLRQNGQGLRCTPLHQDAEIVILRLERAAPGKE